MLRFLGSLFKRPDMAQEEHQAILEAIEQVVEQAKTDSDLTKVVMMLNESSGEWLDLWGSWFDIERDPGESDTDYRQRIIGSATKPSGTIPALIDAVKSFVGDPDAEVTIYEPHENVKRFNISEFSGADVFQSDSYYRSGIVDIRIPNYPVSESLRKSLEQVKAAGVKIYFTSYVSLEGNDGTIIKIVPENEPIFQRTLITPLYINNRDILIRSGSYDPRSAFRSGRLEARAVYTKYTSLASILPDDNPRDVANNLQSLAFPGRRTAAYRSGLPYGSGLPGGFSGYALSQFDIDNPLEWKDGSLVWGPVTFVGVGNVDRIQVWSTVITEIAKTDNIQPTEQRSVHMPERTTSLFSSLGRIIDASSVVKLSEIWELTIEQLDSPAFASQPPFQVTTEPIAG